MNVRCVSLCKNKCSRYDKLRNIIRCSSEGDVQGYIFKDDVFECDEKIALYLHGIMFHGKPLIRILWVEP